MSSEKESPGSDNVGKNKKHSLGNSEEVEDKKKTMKNMKLERILIENVKGQ